MRALLRKSLTFRLTLLFALSSTIVLLVLGVLVARAVDRHFVEQDMDALTGKLSLVRHALTHVHDAADRRDLPQQLEGSLVGHHGLAVVIYAPDGKVFFESEKLQVPAALLDGLEEAGHLGPVTWSQPEGHFRGLSGIVATRLLEWPHVRIVVATEISHHDSFMSEFRRSMWIIVTVAALLMGVLGWVATRRGLQPLRHLIDGASVVTASRLDHRLPVDAVPLELAELAQSLNDMLARLQESFTRLSDFSSDLAHELRTPISNLMTQTQVSLTRARTADEYRDILSSNAEELERMARMVSDMLFLAKADNGLLVPNAEPLRLEEELAGLMEFYEALAESTGLRLQLHGQGSVQGDRLMLRRALSNLISNAIRHAIPGSTVQLDITATGTEWLNVDIRNTGEDIAPETLPRLFDRFYRADFSRQRSSEGAGLGLAITRSIVRAHGGDITVSSTGGETCFSLRLPAA